jgi:hypothetical protein
MGTTDARKSVVLLRPSGYIGVEREISAVIVHKTTASLNEATEQSNDGSTCETQCLK